MQEPALRHKRTHSLFSIALRVHLKNNKMNKKSLYCEFGTIFASLINQTTTNNNFCEENSRSVLNVLISLVSSFFPPKKPSSKSKEDEWLILDPLKCQIQNTRWIFILLVVYSNQIRVILSSGAFYKSHFPPPFKPDTADTATMFHTWLEAEICTPSLHLV